MKIDSIQQYLAIPKDKHALSEHIHAPCASTLIVRRSLVTGNLYNPNSVAPDKLQLLVQSIRDNGFCFPIVTIFDDESERFVIVDGFHRWLVSGEEYLNLEYVPIVVLEHGITERMAATVQFNKARGVHQVDLDAEVIRSLLEQGLTDEEVAVRLGMELDAVHRYKQVAGVAHIFSSTPYSAAWEMGDA